MKDRLLAGLYAAIIAYCVLSATIGAAGLVAERRSAARIAEMRANVAELERSKSTLETRLVALEMDPEALRMEARALGYLVLGERAIKGLPAAVGSPWSEGTLVPFEKPHTPSDRDLKIAAGLIGLGVFTLGLLVPGQRALRRRRDANPRSALHLGRKTA